MDKWSIRAIVAAPVNASICEMGEAASSSSSLYLVRWAVSANLWHCRLQELVSRTKLVDTIGAKEQENKIGIARTLNPIVHMYASVLTHQKAQ